MRRPSTAAEAASETTPELNETAEPSPNGRPTQEEIAREAYLIYLAHGEENGHDQEHWYEAERRLVSATSAPR